MKKLGLVAIVILLITLGGCLGSTKSSDETKNKNDVSTIKQVEKPVPENTGKNLEYELVAKGDMAGKTEKSSMVITDNDSWTQLWGSNKDFKQVDFNKYSLVAIFQGEKPSTGYGVEVASVVETDLYTEVNVREVNPTPGTVNATVMTSPYSIVKVSNNGKKIIIKYISDRELITPAAVYTLTGTITKGDSGEKVLKGVVTIYPIYEDVVNYDKAKKKTLKRDDNTVTTTRTPIIAPMPPIYNDYQAVNIYDGVYTFDKVKQGKYTIVVTDVQGYNVYKENMEVKEKTTYDIKLTKKVEYMVKGTVIKGDTGEKVMDGVVYIQTNAPVYLKSSSNIAVPPYYDYINMTTKIKNGEFSFESGVAAGNYIITVTDVTGYKRDIEYITVEKDTSISIKLDVEKLYTLTGSVVLEGTGEKLVSGTAVIESVFLVYAADGSTTRLVAPADNYYVNKMEIKDGAFAFSNVPQGDYFVRIYDQNGVSVYYESIKVDKDTTVQIKAKKITYFGVKGEVVKGDTGEKVLDGTVYIETNTLIGTKNSADMLPPDYQYISVVTQIKDGVFNFEKGVPAGNYILTVTDVKGYKKHVEYITVSKELSFLIKLEAEKLYKFTGNVLYEGTGELVQGTATIEPAYTIYKDVRDDGTKPVEPIINVPVVYGSYYNKTEIKDGIFVFSDIPQGDYVLRIYTPNSSSEYSQNITIDKDIVLPIMIKKSINYTIKGEVIKGDTGKIVESGVVTLYNNNFDYTTKDPAKPVASMKWPGGVTVEIKDGNFALYNVAAGNYSISITGVKGYKTYSQSVTLDKDLMLNIKLEKDVSYTVSGDVVKGDTGEKVENGTAVIRTKYMIYFADKRGDDTTKPIVAPGYPMPMNLYETVEITNGTFKFEYIPAGEYVIDVLNVKGYKNYSQDLKLETDAKLAISMIKDTTYSVGGTVTKGHTGEKVMDGTAFIEPYYALDSLKAPDSNYYEKMPVKDGTFAFNTVPTGAYSLTIRDVKGYKVYQEILKVTQDIKVEIKLVKEILCVVKGEVVKGDTGEKVTQGMVSIYTNSTDYFPYMSSMPPAGYYYNTVEIKDGTFVFNDIPTGEYIVQISSVQGYSEYSQKITVSADTAMTIKLDATQDLQKLQGRVEIDESNVYIVENWTSKSRVNYKVTGEYEAKIREHKGKIVVVTGKVTEIRTLVASPYYKIIEVKEILNVTEETPMPLIR